jgi:hypothetical protein
VAAAAMALNREESAEKRRSKLTMNSSISSRGIEAELSPTRPPLLRNPGAASCNGHHAE